MKGARSFAAGGILRDDGLFTITLPAHEKATDREHSWRYDWIKSVIAARNNIGAAGEHIAVPVDFVTNVPGGNHEEGAVVIKSYQSGGEILRFENGAWRVAGHQPVRETIQ